MTKSLRENLLDRISKLDFTAIASTSDKVEECRFFLGLASVEADRTRFRWLISAFLNAAYSYFEMLALEAHHRFCGPGGEVLSDAQTLEILATHVTVEKTGKQGRVKTLPLSPLVSALYKVRTENTHHNPLSIMEVGSDLPNDFRIGRVRGEGLPALAFAQEVMDLVDQAQQQVNA